MKKNLKKGHKVRFIPERYDAAVKSDDSVDSSYLRHMDKEGVYMISKECGNVIMLEGHATAIFDKKLFRQTCGICHERDIFRKGAFDKCLRCALDERDRLREEFIASLSPFQMKAFFAYMKAREEAASMIILD